MLPFMFKEALASHNCVCVEEPAENCWCDQRSHWRGRRAIVGICGGLAACALVSSIIFLGILPADSGTASGLSLHAHSTANNLSLQSCPLPWSLFASPGQTPGALSTRFPSSLQISAILSWCFSSCTFQVSSLFKYLLLLSFIFPSCLCCLHVSPHHCYPRGNS